ncbi:MAG: UDP-N-acetylmuramoyl-tripeptide--D-alanyl-D-alanine ligase [Gammaproteobacteria bacterium]|jgi:UDP-N-acetylmuramoyl-tripeptide--D-alanyl-D-alanine ligase
MKNIPAIVKARASFFWDSYKRPVKRMYQFPAIGLAYIYRRTLTKPLFVGVTGSLGKTQTKALIAAVLNQRGRTRYDPSTDNRTYDAAKNLLRTSPSHTACLQEIGMAGPGTMARPVGLFRPDIAVITNIRSDHSSEFETRREHVLEKASIIRGLPATGWAILNADEPDLDVLRSETDANVLTYGFAENADVRATRIENFPPKPINIEVSMDGNLQSVATQLHGAHNVYGVLAALAVGRALDLPTSAAVAAIAKVPSVQGRMQYVEHDDGTGFLLDDFKASEGSLATIVDYLQACEINRGSRFVVLGSITHGSDHLVDFYARFIEEVRNHSDEILLVGSLVAELDRSALPDTVRIFATVKQCADYLLPRLRPHDIVVLKGQLRADHLRRIEIRRRTTVNCWQMFCGRTVFCEDCRFIKENLD